jgi:hypothetical protein
MDMSLVMAALTAQAGNLQNNVAMQMLKSNNDAQKEVVQALLGTPGSTSSQANVASGVGGNLDVSV